MRRQDSVQLALVWKGNGEKHTTAQEGIRRLAFHITGNNNQGPGSVLWWGHTALEMPAGWFDGCEVLGWDVRDLWNVEPALVQLTEQVIWQIAGCLINLVN